MAENPEKLTYEHVRQRSQILFFELAMDGSILQAGTYARKITGCTLHVQKFQDVIVDFDGSFDLNRLVKEPLTDHLLSIRTCSDMPQSYYFHFEPMGRKVLAFGRLDGDELENMRKEVLSLNQELNNLTRQLHKKNAQLHRLNVEKNQFLGMAAHDLRKPIGLIISYAEFLMDEATEVLDPEQMGFLNTIYTACSFMKRLVDDFLDVSAIEAGRFDLDLQPANIDEVLQQSLKLNSLQAVKKKIDLQVQVDKNNGRAVIDASKIEQAITNLVSNAIEHSKPDTTVVVRLSSDQQSLTFSVQDKGPGIAPEERDMLFKPFEKTSTQKTGGEKSTGLGMLITRKIIETHGGQIWVDSELGKGTTVTFKIRLNLGAT